jgi:hypothetical protein
MCMKKISHKKHTAKNSQPTPASPLNASPGTPPDLFPLAGGVKSLDSAWATASQLSPYTGLDDAALRRRARELNPRATPPAPWIPPARGGRWPVAATLRGVCAWYQDQLAAAESCGLPPQCASMKDLERLFHIPVVMQKYIREHGLAPRAFEASNRVNILPMLEAAEPFLSKIFGGSNSKIAEITGFEDLDLDTQRALSTQQDVIEKKRTNALAIAALHTRDGIEKELAEPLAAIFSALKNFEKVTGGKLKSLLAGAGLDPVIVQQAIGTAAAGIQEPLTKLRAQLRLDEPEQPENKKAA